MTRKLGWFLVLMVGVPAFAATVPGSISGYVTNSSGAPQMGVAVEILSSGAAPGTTVFTDSRGHYRAANLPAGAYQVKASAPSYLPTLHESVALRAGANLIVNLTLTTFLEAVQLLPQRRASAQQDDDWKWTLRTVASRPILRVVDDPAAAQGTNRDHNLKAEVAFVAGSENGGFGSAGDMTTQFRLQQSIFSSGTLSLGGNVGYPSGVPAAVVQAGYSHETEGGSRPEVSLTVRHFATPDSVLHDGALDALALSVADTFTVADFMEVNVGGKLQAIDFRGRVNAFRPFGSVAAHLSPDTVVAYRYATSEPDTRTAKGFDTAPADLTEAGPRMSLVNDRPLLEHAQHHEISLSHRTGKNRLQLAIYSDRIGNAALVGVGEVASDGGIFLPDVYSGTFTYNGGNLSTNGLRVVAQRQFLPMLTATLDYAYGGVLGMSGPALSWQEAQSLLDVERRHAAAIKLSGDIPACKTHWIASYNWTSGRALTPVDMFNASPGQADPYLSIFIRQPLPTWFQVGHLEALLDIRNLLAQGYVPVLGPDGQTLYLVQAARSIRGGLAFTF